MGYTLDSREPSEEWLTSVSRKGRVPSSSTSYVNLMISLFCELRWWMSRELPFHVNIGHYRGDRKSHGKIFLLFVYVGMELDFKQNSNSLMISVGGKAVRSNRVSSERNRLWDSLTGTLVNNDSTSKERRISFLLT